MAGERIRRLGEGRILRSITETARGISGEGCWRNDWQSSISRMLASTNRAEGRWDACPRKRHLIVHKLGIRESRCPAARSEWSAERDSRIVRREDESRWTGRAERASPRARERTFDARKFPCNDLEDCGRHGHGRVIYAARKSRGPRCNGSVTKSHASASDRTPRNFDANDRRNADWISRAGPFGRSFLRKWMDNWEMKSWRIRELDTAQLAASE